MANDGNLLENPNFNGAESSKKHMNNSNAKLKSPRADNQALRASFKRARIEYIGTSARNFLLTQDLEVEALIFESKFVMCPKLRQSVDVRYHELGLNKQI